MFEKKICFQNIPAESALRQRRREFEQACCEYMDEFGFEWVEEFTLNRA